METLPVTTQAELVPSTGLLSAPSKRKLTTAEKAFKRIARRCGMKFRSPLDLLIMGYLQGVMPAGVQLPKNSESPEIQEIAQDAAEKVLMTHLTAKDRKEIGLALLPYIMPKLQQMQLTGAEGGPIKLNMDASKVFSGDAMRTLMETAQEELALIYVRSRQD